MLHYYLCFNTFLGLHILSLDIIKIIQKTYMIYRGYPKYPMKITSSFEIFKYREGFNLI